MVLAMLIFQRLNQFLHASASVSICEELKVAQWDSDGVSHVRSDEMFICSAMIS